MFVRCLLLTAAVVLFGFLLVFCCLVVTSFACSLGMGMYGDIRLDGCAAVPFCCALTLLDISLSTACAAVERCGVGWGLWAP